MSLSYEIEFAKDEQVLCFHHDLLWEAKILDSKRVVRDDGISGREYLVHYKGWKKTYDEWVSYDRLRTFNTTNQELAEKLKKDAELHPRTTPKGSKRKAASSDIGSAPRDGEEGTSSVSAAARGKRQRGGDSEFEKVRHVSSSTRSSVSSNGSPPARPSPASSPGLPGSPKDDHPHPDLSGKSDSPPAKRRRVSPASEDGASTSPPSPPSSPTSTASASQPAANHLFPLSFVRGSALQHSPPPRPRSRSPSPLAPSHPPATLPSSVEDILGSDLSSAPSSPDREKLEPEKSRRGHKSHEIFGDAVLGTKYPSKNDPSGIHGPRLDYPCGRRANLMHKRPEYPTPAGNPYAQPCRAMRTAPRASAAKRVFYEGQNPAGKLMVAGKPLERKGAVAGSQSPGRKSRVSKKRCPAKGKGKGKGKEKKVEVDDSLEQEAAAAAAPNPPPSNDESSSSSPPAAVPAFPERLKSLLVDDWENVTSKLDLVPLPSHFPVNAILTEYEDEVRDARGAPGSPEADFFSAEVVGGLKEYFEVALGRALLYRFEREQYFQVRQSMQKGEGEWAGKNIGDIYGAEHLCRLLVSIPRLVAESTMEHEQRTKFLAETDLLARWLNLNRNFYRYFATPYETPTVEYIVRARGN
ncbi:Esa1p-associated factor [Pseudocyphellaria aurata]|nr:Esa1p-associated factor [Pseudocyphellaria aurata]